MSNKLADKLEGMHAEGHIWITTLAAAALARNVDADPLPMTESFQSRVAPWMQECFGEEISRDVRERGDRLLEEVLELLQSHGYDPARVATLRDYVFGRPVGEPAQEVGGVMVTLAAYCLATNLDMHAAGETELARIWTKVETIRAKQASKRGLHTPLPAAYESEGEFLTRTNREYAEWCAQTYRAEDLDVRGHMSLHGLWAWQAQARRLARKVGA